MTQRIYKYLVMKPNGDQPSVRIPTGARPLYVGWQDGVYLWALVSLDQPEEPRTFEVYGTGHPIQGEVAYIGTVMDPRGYVWHVVEEQR